MGFDSKVPYNDLPPLPPDVDIESKPVLKACIAARAALAELKSTANRIPNQTVLINTIPLLEARASSEIENIVTTSDALFRFAQMESATTDPATKEALRYRTALKQGFETLRDRPLCTNTAIEVCSWIKNTEMQIRRVPGIALANAATGSVVYTPPEGESTLREKLANWEHFVHDAREIDPLIRMAVAHYQFEAIHPFTDGNGRTGRILNLLMLVEQGLLKQPILYLSRYILGHRSEYYERLLAVTRNGDWEAWLLFMLKGVAETASWTSAKIQAIKALEESAINWVRKSEPKIYTRELVEILFVQPYCRIQNLVEAGIAKRQTASVYLQKLIDLGMLKEIAEGREKLFMHTRFIKLLTSDEHIVEPY